MHLKYLKKIILVCIALLLILIGLALIFVPLPTHSFEIATLYYFNPNDGITVMDLIALLLIFCGLYIFIQVLYPEKK